MSKSITRCWSKPFIAFYVTLLFLMALFTLLRFQLVFVKKQLYKKEFILEILQDQRSSEHSEKSKFSTPHTKEKKQKGYLHFQSSYSISRPANQMVAWKPVVFSIRPQPASKLLVGRTAFRGEVTHRNEVLVLDIKHTGGDAYIAEFVPSFDGEYTITVVVSYVNGEHFNYGSHVTSRMTPIEGSPLRLTVRSRPPPVGITRYCSQSESGTARGRWVRCGSLRDMERCGPWQVNKTYDFDKLHGFFWLPYACQLHQYTNLEMKTCFARNGWEKIVLTGDSHSRFRTYHWATRLYGKCENCGKTYIASRFELVPKMEWVFDARGTRWAATFPSITRPTEIYIQPKSRRSMFSYPLPNTTHNGDLYLMNFGHWLLREVTFRKFMADKLRAHVAAVKLMNNSRSVNSLGVEKPKSKRFLWVNTMSLTWREDRHVRYWNGTPCPSTISYMNSFIDASMKKAGIQIVDAFQVSNARLKASFDKTHYAKMFPNNICAGVVENAVTNLILNALCNE